MRHKIGEILVECGLKEEHLREALSRQKKTGKRVGKTLIELGRATEAQIVDALSRQLGIPVADVRDVVIDKELLALVTQQDAEKNLILPLKLESKKLTVAMVNPLDHDLINKIQFVTGYAVSPVLASESAIIDAIEKHYQVEVKAFHLMNSIQTYDDAEFLLDRAEDRVVNVQSLYKLSETPPIIQLVTMIIVEAVKMRASDIHIEPREEQVGVRYRIDGDLREVLTIPKRIKDYVTSRIKIIANMDITNRRTPQDGTSKLKLADREVDLRISTLPSLYGEKVVIRLLDKSKGLISLTKVGFPEDITAPLVKILTQPQGLILVTGPTGSGKSTTLYAVLQQVKSEKENVVTIEDPVEYRLSGVTQVGINEAIGLTFPGVLRSVLRQDPDIIMVGEVRDFETADIAIKSALTGHLVLTTLHTNDTVSSLTRLIDLGVPSFLAASSLSCILAQRLVKRICPHCRVQEKENPLAAEIKGVTASYRGKGCHKCYNTGYYGQVGVFEFLPLSRKIRSLVSNKASEQAIWNEARTLGVRTLFEDGVQKINRGITTVEEVLVKVPNLFG